MGINKFWRLVMVWRIAARCKTTWIVVFCTLLHCEIIYASQVYDFHELKEGFASFPAVQNNWGMENLSFGVLENKAGAYMHVFVPKGAIDPGSMKTRGLPRGGAGFKSEVFPQGVDHALLSYRVRFPPDFDFVRGGKLPGLYGGLGNTGGVIPNGTDGFSFRVMWGKKGEGEVYAYLPSSIKFGTGIFYNQFKFIPGQWHKVLQELKLNDPGRANGELRMWVDDVLVGEKLDLVVRTVDSLHINGLLFNVFFGGNDDTWAPPHDTYIDFSNFIIRDFAG